MTCAGDFGTIRPSFSTATVQSENTGFGPSQYDPASECAGSESGVFSFTPMPLTLDQKTALIWKVLKRRWPDLFRYKNRVPLAIGIREQILAEIPTMDAKALSFVLRKYTKGYKYLVALSRGGVRRNLDGSVSEPVSSDHQEQSGRGVEAIRDRVKSKATG